MGPSAVRWGAEGFRRARKLIVWYVAWMVREAVHDSRSGMEKGSPRPSQDTSVVDQSRELPEMQPEALMVKMGYNCDTVMCNGSVLLWVAMDTGAPSSFMRTSLVEQLRKSRKMKGAVCGSRPRNRPFAVGERPQRAPFGDDRECNSDWFGFAGHDLWEYQQVGSVLWRMVDCADSLILEFPDLVRFGSWVK